MDNHRSGPICNHAAFARGVLKSCMNRLPLAPFLRGDSPPKIDAFIEGKMLAVKDEAMTRNIVDLEELVLKCQSVQSRA
jgi:hypothetical protein